jgi:hypothetical protein
MPDGKPHILVIWGETTSASAFLDMFKEFPPRHSFSI